MLSLLSGSPRPFSAYIPSKDHKGAYLDILAWLMRGGWVTQLRSFAWVRVPGEVQDVVAREEEKDEMEGRLGSEDSGTEETGSAFGDSYAGEPDVPPGSLSSLRSSALSTRSSISSARTAIPLIMQTSVGSLEQSEQQQQKMYPAKLLLQPTKASGLESRWLAAMSRDMARTQGEETREAWEKCLKYFNGEHALEKIAVREGWKRKKVEGWRAIWGRMGVLVEVRHW